MDLFFELLGYAASAFVAASLYMRTITALRVLSIASNVLFIIFALYKGNVPSILILHSLLLPMNILRLLQIRKLIAQVEEASKGDGSLTPLIPFMKRQSFTDGEVLFRKGDQADRLYYIQKGEVELPELGHKALPPEVIGEIGVFSPFKLRTASAVCRGPVEAYTIDEAHIKQLYFQNPKFGYHLVQLIIRRLLAHYRPGECPDAEELEISR